GTVYTNVNSALSKARTDVLALDFIAGLGGRNISRRDIREMFVRLKEGLRGKKQNFVQFVNLGVDINE
ncbi:MAG: pyruvate ferredoxin oxidoreductase, partial [Methanotrichaceae archaeon]